MALSSDDYKNCLEIIEIAYSLPGRNTMLQAVCERLAKVLRLSSGVLVPADSRTGQFQFDQNFLFRCQTKEFLDYIQHYASLDPFASNKWIWKYNNEVACYTDFVSETRLADSEYGRDFLPRVPLFYCLCATLGSQGDPIGAMGLHRHQQDGDFSDREKEIMHILAPHLSRALRYSSLLEERHLSKEIGVIVMRIDGQLLYIDEEAGKALHGRPPEVIPDPGSSASPAFLRTETGTYRVRTIPVSLDKQVMRIGTIPADLASGVPLTTSNAVVHPYGSAKIILLEPIPSRWSLQQKLSRFGLSSRQEEIATLVIRGLSNHEIAERLFIAEQTVKDHLHDIFEKTQVRRRSELIAKTLGMSVSSIS